LAAGIGSVGEEEDGIRKPRGITSADGRDQAGQAITHFLLVGGGDPMPRMGSVFLEGEHLVPFEERDPGMITAHRQFLQRGYEEGRFLLSGPSVPPTGGVLVARAESREQLVEFLADEPFCKARLMRFNKIIEFNPVQHQPILAEWFSAS
jgi:uncharacterized protein YciI